MPELKLRKSSEFVEIKPRAGVDPRELAERVTAALRAPDHHRLIGAVNPTAWVDREVVMVHIGLSASTPTMVARAQEMLLAVLGDDGAPSQLPKARLGRAGGARLALVFALDGGRSHGDGPVDQRGETAGWAQRWVKDDPVLILGRAVELRSGGLASALAAIAEGNNLTLRERTNGKVRWLRSLNFDLFLTGAIGLVIHGDDVWDLELESIAEEMIDLARDAPFEHRYAFLSTTGGGDFSSASRHPFVPGDDLFRVKGHPTLDVDFVWQRDGATGVEKRHGTLEEWWNSEPDRQRAVWTKVYSNARPPGMAAAEGYGDHQ